MKNKIHPPSSFGSQPVAATASLLVAAVISITALCAYGQELWRVGANVGAPSPRAYPAAIWTGREMIIWGGYNSGGAGGALNTGARFDPVANTWTALPTNGAPSPRYAGPSSWPVWTGSEMIIWGGYDGNTYTASGARFNTNSNTWTPISTNGAPEARGGHVAVWTGSEMLVWGGYQGSKSFFTGGRYNPANDTWTEMATNGAPRGSFSVVWTGSEMIVWGGGDASGVVNTGGRYNPVLNSWRAISITNAPSARWTQGAVWTGTEMIVWGGRNSDDVALDTGGRYNPASDTWTVMTTDPIGRWGTTPVWSGREMLVWGGAVDFADLIATGGRYDPSADKWTAMTMSGAPSARYEHSAVWTGESMIVFGGYGNSGPPTGTFLYTPPPPPSLFISDATVIEGNTGTTNAVFTVNLATNHSTFVSFNFTTVDGGATAGSDYLATSGTLIFNPGKTNKTITVPVLGDTLNETNEIFFVRLSNPTNISLTVTQAIGNIIDDDIETLYVNVNNPNPVPPYTSWATAATTIQDAVDVAVGFAGDVVLVTNGVYRIGGRVVDGATNRVAVTKPLTIRSVNGPEATLIQGNGVRCAYLTNGAALLGFTLTNGKASLGGGAYGGTLKNCTLTGNSAGEGGGAYGSGLDHCTLTGNSAGGGGGASQSFLDTCALYGNSASSGGGASGSDLHNCTVVHNSANEVGGVRGGFLVNCIVYHNTSRTPVLAFYDQEHQHNLISLEQIANHSGSMFFFSCTTPLPEFYFGNISAEPQLVSGSHLSATSPCRAAGVFLGVIGSVDINGEAWANPPSMGCDEFRAGEATGPLTVAIQVNYTNPVPGFVLDFQSQISGRLTASRWEFDDGTVVSNQFSVSRQWTTTGDHPVVLRAYNESFPQGVTATTTVHVVAQPVHYVSLNSANPTAPYSSWATAATNIQDAVDAAALIPGTLVLVSNGVYQTGTRFVDEALNRVVVAKPLTVRSVNGPEVTMIVGDSHSIATNSAVRCVYMGDGATLTGFTLINGLTYYGFGGVWCASAKSVVSNCVLKGNSGYIGGGAVFGGTLMNCTFAGNSTGGAAFSTLNNCIIAGNDGGGVGRCTLNNCVVTGNAGSGASLSALNNCTLTGNSTLSDGGGAYACILNNCILAGNSAREHGNDEYDSTLNHCYFGDPGFINPTNGDFRLQTNSPCINAGRNLSAPSGPDLGGNPRIVGGTVDIGAYEFQSPLSQISYRWLRDYALPINAATDSADPDGDGATNYQEWRAGTDPNYSSSVLRMLPPVPSASGVIVSWWDNTDGGRGYFVERSSNLGAQPSFMLVQSNIFGRGDLTTFTDTNAIGAGPFFYRVGVHEAVDEDD